MKVFLSWSGPRSKAAALMLRQWLPDVIQSIEPWMSAEDIDAGARWNNELTNKLAETRCGIICLTKDNQLAPWVLFEAGALSKSIEKTFVIPYLIDLVPSDILPGPLTQFQTKRANKAETWELVRTLNGALDKPLTDEQLKRGFERCWQELETSLKDLPAATSHQAVTRSQGDMLIEVLDEVRRMARAMSDDISPRLELQGKLVAHILKSIPASNMSIPFMAASEELPRLTSPKEPHAPRNYRDTNYSMIRSNIESVLNVRGTVKASDLIEMFDPRLEDLVFNELEKMRRSEIINYLPPIDSETLIHCEKSTELDDLR
jgi:TIR domain